MIPGAGTLINVVAILAGSAIGAVVGHRLREGTRELTTDVLGLVTAVGGIASAMSVSSVALTDAIGTSWPTLVVLGSLLLGGYLGRWLDIEGRLEAAGEVLKRRVQAADSDFGVGFVTSSLVFCIGPLAIMGAFDDAMGLGLDKLLLKSALDLFAAMAFAASLGWGVAASAVSVGVYQGLMTLLGLGLGSIWSDAQIASVSAVGGLMLVGIGLRLLRIREIQVGNLLPALFVAPGLVWLVSAL